MRCRRVFVAVFSCLSLIAGGCMVGPKYVRPTTEQPTGFKSQPGSEASAPIAADWWRLYADPELDQLIGTAQRSNQTLGRAVARVDEARALARVAGSYLYPTVSLDPSYSRTRYSGARASTITAKQVPRGVDISNWTIPLDLSYEVDVWGRVRGSLEAARATAAATEDDVGVVRLTLETDVAQFYYTIRSLDAQTRILEETVAAYQEQVRVLSVQLRTGLVSGIVVSQAQAQLQATQAQLSNNRRARAGVEHALAILCGRPAPTFTVAANALQDVSPPVVPAGLPAQLLTRRPDVAEAEKNVVAANAQIGVATAEFYPRFILTASAGFSSLNADMLFTWQSRVAQILPSVSIPLFQGGRLRANLDATKARYRQTVSIYVEQVLVAYGDVEDALTDLYSYGDQVASLRIAAAESQNYLRLAQVQYRQGLVDYLLVLDAERTLLGNQLALAQAVNLQMNASIHLIKALGGGWNPSEV